ncbi:hypothetical protein BST61_g10390 [Cercospora zeina]
MSLKRRPLAKAARKSAPPMVRVPYYSDDEDESEAADKNASEVADKSALQRMYETGEGFDLTVEAIDGKMFMGHKSVVCPASSYISKACTTVCRETPTARVTPPESPPHIARSSRCGEKVTAMGLLVEVKNGKGQS